MSRVTHANWLSVPSLLWLRSDTFVVKLTGQVLAVDTCMDLIALLGTYFILILIYKSDIPTMWLLEYKIWTLLCLLIRMILMCRNGCVNIGCYWISVRVNFDGTVCAVHFICVFGTRFSQFSMGYSHSGIDGSIILGCTTFAIKKVWEVFKPL